MIWCERNPRMRSALVVTDSLVWTAETEYAVAVAGAEAAMGISVKFAAPAGSLVAARVKEDVEFLELPGASPSSSVADFVADARFLSRLVQRGSYDVVHSSRPTAHILAALASGGRAPLVHLRGSASVPSGHAGNRFLYTKATASVIASSSRVKHWIEERLGVPPGRVHRLHAPIAESWFEPAGDAEPLSGLGIAAGAPVVLNVARLSPVKGHEHLLDAMASVISSVPEAVLLLVGEPWSGQPEGLEARARELGIVDSVVFAGRREDVRELVDAASVCVTSSVGSEENSRAVAEYMAGGRPVVATAVGVIPELVLDGETGYLIPPGEPGPMADAIVGMLGNRALAERMGSLAREVARERFSAPAFVDGLTRVLAAAGVAV